MKYTLSGFLLAAGALLHLLPLPPGALAESIHPPQDSPAPAAIGPHEAREPSAGLSRAVRIRRTHHIEGEDLDLRAEYSPKIRGGPRAAPWSVYSSLKGRRLASGGGAPIDHFRLGGSKRLSHRLLLSGDTAIAEDGVSSAAAARYRAGEHIRLYGSYNAHAGRTGMGCGNSEKTFTPGIRVRVSPRAALFGEERLQRVDGSRALTHVFGLDLAPGRDRRLRLSLEAGRRIDPGEGAAPHCSARLSIGWGAGHFRYNGELEMSAKGADADDWLGGSTRHSMDYHLGREWRLHAGLKAAYSPPRETSTYGEVLSEWEAGLASGPADDERFRLLLKYTLLGAAGADLQADVQVGVCGRLTESTRFGLGYNLADFPNTTTAPGPDIRGWFLEISAEL
jgi:hypothetical protein